MTSKHGIDARAEAYQTPAQTDAVDLERLNEVVAGVAAQARVEIWRWLHGDR